MFRCSARCGSPRSCVGCRPAPRRRDGQVASPTLSRTCSVARQAAVELRPASRRVAWERNAGSGRNLLDTSPWQFHHRAGKGRVDALPGTQQVAPLLPPPWRQPAAALGASQRGPGSSQPALEACIITAAAAEGPSSAALPRFHSILSSLVVNQTASPPRRVPDPAANLS